MQNLPRLTLLLASASALAACATAPQTAVAPLPPQTATAAVAPAAPPEPQAAPLSALVQAVNIPHTEFHLANGLTVIVHEDHKAPVVAVSAWYNVGSKDEPPGKDGYAHLFEHLMFTGSDNLPGDYFKYLQQLGATDYNGTTWFDRTNYFETVPKAGLERALFMESDRMGYLLGSLNQKRLDAQRAVVENEKRQDDNQPGGLVQYELLADLFPPGHPYHHPTIGSIPDLDKATLADVKEWFINHYGPNNAVLVLAGDVTPAEARPLVEKYFGPIARGPVNVPAAADVPTLAEPKTVVMKDRVAAVQLQRDWAVPGMTDIRDLAALDLGSSILGGLASSRLDRILVRDEKLAVSVSASLQPFQRISLFEIDASVKPGVDPALVDKRIGEILADFIANGPTADEVQRAATDEVSGRIHGLEKVGGQDGKAVALAEGQLLAGDSDYYKKSLDAYASMTPADIKAAMQKWITRPAVEIKVEPGDRPPYQESTYKPSGKSADLKIPVVKRAIPPIGQPELLHFPTIEHATLSNGLKVEYAQRTAVPVTRVDLWFDAGYSADAPNERGLQNLTMSLLDEGAAGLTSQQIAEREERLGAAISADGGADRSAISLSALSTNLAPSLDLMADIAERPTFDSNDIERVRAQVLTGIAEQQKDPDGIAARALPPLLIGACESLYRRRRSGGGKGIHTRRYRRLPAAVAASGQCPTVRGLGPAVGGTAADARSALRSLDSTVRAKGGEAVSGGSSAAEGTDHPHRSARIAAVGHRRRRDHADQSGRAYGCDHRGERRARRKLPFAHEHGRARNQRLVLRRQRRSLAPSEDRPLCGQRSGAGGPHRRRHRGDPLRHARLSDDQAGHRRRTQADDHQPDGCSPGRIRNGGIGVERDGDSGAAEPAGQLLRALAAPV